MKQKTKLLITSLFLVIGVAAFGTLQAQAGSFVGVLATLSTSTTSTHVGSNIVFTLHGYYNHCTSNSDPSQSYDVADTCQAGYSKTGETPDADDNSFLVTATGSGNTLSASSVTTDGSGNTQVTLSSSVAETKTVNIAWGQPTYVVASHTVTFTPPSALVPVTPTPPKKSTPGPVTPTAPIPDKAPPAIGIVPAAPTTTVKVGDSVVKPTETPTVKPGQPLVLSGTTVPSGVVKLFVHSVLHTYTITASKTGVWSYTVPVTDLPSGSHHIDAQVTDPVTSKTSAQVQVLAFSLTKSLQAVASTTATTQTPMSKLGFVLIVIGIVISSLVVITAVGAVYLWKFQTEKFNRLLQHLGLKEDNHTNTPVAPFGPRAQG